MGLNKAENPSWLDRFARTYAPGWAASREEARLRLSALEQAKGVQASYRGGISTRTSTPWTQSISYARGTTADRRSLGDMRSRARRVWRENPIGRSILQTEVTNVVADGFTLEAKTVDAKFNAEAEDQWEQWLDNADVRGMLDGSGLQRQAYRSSRRDGDGGFVLVDRGGYSKLQYISGDLIKTPDARQGDMSIADGVEVDASSKPIRFHVLDTDEYGKRVFTPIPASNFVYLTPDLDDDLAVRGPTCYSTVFGYLDQIDGYIDAVTIAARMAAVFGLIFRSATSGKQIAGLPSLVNSQGIQQKALTLENGSLKYIGADDEIVQVQAQQPMQQTPDFIRALMRLIGMPFDMPLELISHDMSQVNFSSARIGLLSYYRACMARQKWFRKRCLSRIYQWWLSRERKRQLIGMSDAFVTPFPDQYWNHCFRPRAWDYTDPVREAQSDLLQISMGTKSPQMVAAERGSDWEEVQIELAAAQAFRRLNDIPSVLSNMTRDVVSIPGDAGPQQPAEGDGLKEDSSEN